MYISVIAIIVATFLLNKILPACLNFILQYKADLLEQEGGIVAPHIVWNGWQGALLIAGILCGAVFRLENTVLLVHNVIIFLLLLMIAIIDWKYGYVFDEMLVLLAVLLLGHWLYLDVVVWQRVANFVVGGAGMLLIAVLSRGGMGGGDIKMTAVLGLGFAPLQFLHMLTLAFVSGAVVGVLLVLLRKKTRGESMAFAPYLSWAALVYILL